MKFSASPQQGNVFNWVLTGVGSAVVEAVAGSGKTTTLVEALRLMKGTIFFGAYNKNIAVEIEERTGKRFGLFVSTLHSIGFRTWMRFATNVKVDKEKVQKIFIEACTRHPEYTPYQDPVIALVSYAKQAALGVNRSMDASSEWMRLIEHFNIDTLDNDELVMKLARQVLKRSNDMALKFIDFDDMVYVPLLHPCHFYTHDWVLIDEAQDTNEARRLLALKLLKKGGRLVAVGDRHQAIYGFTGADSDALDLISQAVDAVRLPLTVTYRCPKSVVKHAKTFVNHIEAHESAPDGEVITLKNEDLAKTAIPGDAILSRFNAPNVTLAYSLIAAGLPARVEGREIGTGLIKLAKRLKAKDFDQFLSKLEEYQERETEKLIEKKQQGRVAAVEDACNCLRVVVDRIMNANKQDSGKPADLIEAEVNSIFGDVDSKDLDKYVLLTSIHKSKGREWNRVFWLQTGPSKWARQQWEMEQETNLMYVATTRAKHTLYLLEMK